MAIALFTRPLDPVADGPALHALFGDEASCRYLPQAATHSVAQTITLLKQWMSDSDDVNWVIAERMGGPALGRVAVFPRRKRDVWEAAYMTVPAARGRNLAARALALALDHAFEHLGARRIMADVDPDNLPSIRVVEKLGFAFEGRLRGEWETHIGVRDSLIYGLLRDDARPWRARDAP